MEEKKSQNKKSKLIIIVVVVIIIIGIPLVFTLKETGTKYIDEIDRTTVVSEDVGSKIVLRSKADDYTITEEYKGISEEHQKRVDDLTTMFQLVTALLKADIVLVEGEEIRLVKVTEYDDVDKWFSDIKAKYYESATLFEDVGNTDISKMNYSTVKDWVGELKNFSGKHGVLIRELGDSLTQETTDTFVSKLTEVSEHEKIISSDYISKLPLMISDTELSILANEDGVLVDYVLGLEKVKEFEAVVKSYETIAGS